MRSMNFRFAGFLGVIVVAACIACYFFFDIPALYWLNSKQGAIRSAFGLITYLGLSTPYLILSALAFIWFRLADRKPLFSNMALFVFTCVASAGIANDILKFLVGRSRPNLLLQGNIYELHFFSFGYGYNSFPSGHANTAAALALALCIVSGKCRPVYIVPALAVMLSRVVIGAHFISDVVFGSYLALVMVLLVKAAFERAGLEISQPGKAAAGKPAQPGP